MPLRLILLFVLLVLALPFTLPAVDLKVSEDDVLRKIAEETRKKFNLPGLCIALLDGNCSVRVAAAGIRKVGDESAMKVQDLCHLGSCTKAMTATMIACVIRPVPAPSSITGPPSGSSVAAISADRARDEGARATTWWGFFRS